MMFEWQPMLGAPTDHKPRVARAKLGDGYEQRGADGLNSQLRTYSPTFEFQRETIKDIDDFLRDRGAIESFYFVPNDANVPVKVVCDSWKVQRIKGKGFKYRLTAKFREVPA